MSVILEGALDQEMDEELGYSKYNYRNNETDNSRNRALSKDHAYQLSKVHACQLSKVHAYQLW